MQGDYVIARSYGDVPIVRRVWSMEDNVVFICTDERYNQLKNGKNDLLLIGFLKQDIYEYDEKILAQLSTDPNSWQKLKPWQNKEVQ